MYEIILTGEEINHLSWLVNHGYFPTETYDALTLADGEPDDEEISDKLPRKWQIPEHAAWAISQHREEDPDSLFACTGGELLTKLIALENSIV